VNILFVCTGNMCRSPFAEYCLKDRLGREPLPGGPAVVGSAGTMAMDGHRAAEDAVTFAAEFGLSLEPHRARQLSEELLDAAELVLVMDRSHEQTIVTFWPYHREKIRYLTEFDPEGGGKRKDVADPYGGSARGYRKSFQLISRCVDGLVENLRSR
jgi:protein-tyrosine phosphatase